MAYIRLYNIRTLSCPTWSAFITNIFTQPLNPNVDLKNRIYIYKYMSMYVLSSYTFTTGHSRICCCLNMFCARCTMNHKGQHVIELSFISRISLRMCPVSNVILMRSALREIRLAINNHTHNIVIQCVLKLLTNSQT